MTVVRCRSTPHGNGGRGEEPRQQRSEHNGGRADRVTKAIDLVDEAAASVKMSSTSKPIELNKLEKEIRSLEIEREAIFGEERGKKKEENKKSPEK